MKLQNHRANSSFLNQTKVNLGSLSSQQLRALQSRISSELEHLTSSHAKLRAAQSKFRDCVRSINEGVVGSQKKGTDGRDDILVPLTSSLYVKGKMADREKVLVDVGTGFYVEKVCCLSLLTGVFSYFLVAGACSGNVCIMEKGCANT